MTLARTVYLLAVTSAFVTSLIALPFWRRWCYRVGLVDEPGTRKIHSTAIPLAGGLAVATGVILPILAGVILFLVAGRDTEGITNGPIGKILAMMGIDEVSTGLLEHGLKRRFIQLSGILLGAIGMLVVGIIDDKHELRAGTKFLGQLLIAALVAASGVRITLFVPSLAFSYLVTILWLLTVINAFNFMDNMNGLCTGLGTIGAWYLATVAAAKGQYLVALIAFLAFGALAGFLPYNFPKARAFLGDAGSHLVGYLLAVLAILPHFYAPGESRRAAVLIPLLVLFIPLLDLAWVVILRWRLGKPFHQADTNHLSHRLVRLGLSQVHAVLLIWLGAALIGAVVYFF